MADIHQMAYLASSLCCLGALGGLSSQSTARVGYLSYLILSNIMCVMTYVSLSYLINITCVMSVLSDLVLSYLVLNFKCYPSDYFNIHSYMAVIVDRNMNLNTHTTLEN